MFLVWNPRTWKFFDTSLNIFLWWWSFRFVLLVEASLCWYSAFSLREVCCSNADLLLICPVACRSTLPPGTVISNATHPQEKRWHLPPPPRIMTLHWILATQNAAARGGPPPPLGWPLHLSINSFQWFIFFLFLSSL